MEPMEERVAQGQASAVDDGAAHTVYVRNIFERMKIEGTCACMEVAALARRCCRPCVQLPGIPRPSWQR